MGACLLSEFILWFSPDCFVSNSESEWNAFPKLCAARHFSSLSWLREGPSQPTRGHRLVPDPTNTDLRERENNEQFHTEDLTVRCPGLQTIDNIGPKFHTWETLIITRSAVTSILLLVTGFLSCFVCLCLWLVTVCVPVLLVVCFCRTVQFSVFNPQTDALGPVTCWQITQSQPFACWLVSPPPKAPRFPIALLCLPVKSSFPLYWTSRDN